MELCTTQAVSNLSKISKHHRILTTNPNNLIRYKISLPLERASISCGLHSRIPFCSNSLPRATTSEETSSGANYFIGEERDGVITLEDVPPVEKNVYNESGPKDVVKDDYPVDEQMQTFKFLEQMQTFEFLDNLNIKLDSDDAYSILLYGSGSLVALWLASAIVGSIDSIPLFPKLMEVVGLGYTFWFTSRYLLFKKNRGELAAKIEELKQQVLGSNDD